MITIPSLNALADAFGFAAAAPIRGNFDRQRAKGVEYLRLGAAAEYLNAEGVGYVEIRGLGTVAYVEMGDPYKTTLLRVKGRVRIGDWGTLAERHGTE